MKISFYHCYLLFPRMLAIQKFKKSKNYMYNNSLLWILCIWWQYKRRSLWWEYIPHFKD